MEKTVSNYIIEELDEWLTVFLNKIAQPRSLNDDKFYGKLLRLSTIIMNELYREQELTMSYFAQKYELPAPRITKAVDQLVYLGVVSRTIGLKDRRMVKIKLTPYGIYEYERCQALIKIRSQEYLNKYFTPQEQEELYDIIHKFGNFARRIGND